MKRLIIGMSGATGAIYGIRLLQILKALDGRAGDIAVLPLAPRRDRPAKRIVVTARKGAKGPFRLAPAFVLHAGPRHEADRDDYTPEAQAILKDGAALTF